MGGNSRLSDNGTWDGGFWQIGFFIYGFVDMVFDCILARQIDLAGFSGLSALVALSAVFSSFVLDGWLGCCLKDNTPVVMAARLLIEDGTSIYAISRAGGIAVLPIAEVSLVFSVISFSILFLLMCAAFVPQLVGGCSVCLGPWCKSSKTPETTTKASGDPARLENGDGFGFPESSTNHDEPSNKENSNENTETDHSAGTSKRNNVCEGCQDSTMQILLFLTIFAVPVLNLVFGIGCWFDFIGMPTGIYVVQMLAGLCAVFSMAWDLTGGCCCS